MTDDDKTLVARLLDRPLRKAMKQEFDAISFAFLDKAAARLTALIVENAELRAKGERMAEALEKIVAQDFWTAVDERDEVDGRCAEVARAALTDWRGGKGE